MNAVITSVNPLAADAPATTIAAAVKAGAVSAIAVAEAALARIEAGNARVNAFTEVTTARALKAAEAVDAAIAAGRDPGPLAGVPYAVKNLFDIEGLVTLAGSKINRDHAPAVHDATPITMLDSAGAVLVGALNMDEYAYGFTTENSHYGPCRNPHDTSRIAGGSSGGSGAAVAAGLVPLTLGSDTNGSVRVPSGLCGIFGIKPTYGRITRGGMALFAGSFDHTGILGLTAGDLALAFDRLQGADPRDPVATDRPATAALAAMAQGTDGLRVGVLGGHFAEQGEPEMHAGVAKVAAALGARGTAILPEAGRARGAAMIITAAEGGALHLPDLRTRPQDFDPATRDRFIAGAVLPAAWYDKAQRFRHWYRDAARKMFEDFDVVLAPTTPCPAQPIGQETIMLAGKPYPMRPFMGIFTQPLSFIGLPVISAPVVHDGPLPIGVQLVAAPWNEAALFRAAAALEAAGIVAAKVTT